MPTVVEKISPDRIETCLILGQSNSITTETSQGTTTETTETSQGITTETTETLREITTETTETTETSQGTTTETTETSVVTTESVLELIRANSKITLKEIAVICGITADGAAYHIRKLKRSGRITRVGGSRNGGEWKVN